MARRLKLMADYGCHPLWDYDEGGELCGNPAPVALPLSTELVAEINAWADWFNSWVDMRDPHDSRRVLPEEAEAFNRAGRRLWAALRRELGEGWCVVYFEDGKLLEPPG